MSNITDVPAAGCSVNDLLDLVQQQVRAERQAQQDAAGQEESTSLTQQAITATGQPTATKDWLVREPGWGRWSCARAVLLGIAAVLDVGSRGTYRLLDRACS